MTDEDSRDAAQPSREATGRPAGFFASRAAIKRSLRFRDLVIQRKRWAMHINVARPPEELIPRNTKPEHYHLAIDAAINELIPLIHRDLTIAGVSTEFEFTGNPEWDPERKRVVHDKRYLDVIDNYFEIPYPSTASSFNVVLSVIQRGVGVYEARKRRAFWENLNPLRWLAGLLRVPIFVLEEAGYLTPQSKPWVLSVLKIAFPIALAVAVLVLAKFFGIKLPPELLKHLKIEP